jgi:hypothetical protein
VADSTNRLSVNSSAVLFNNVGNGTQLKLNKAATGDSATFLFQTNWSGRAEIGTSGNDDFSFKVSPDGSNWYTGLVLKSGAKGVPVLPSFATVALPAAATAGSGALAYNSTCGCVVTSNGSDWGADEYVLASSGVAVSHTGDTAKTTLGTVTIPGGAIGPNGYITIDVTFSTTNNANAKNIMVEFGGNTVTNLTATSTASIRLCKCIFNRNSASSQISVMSAGLSNSYTSSTTTLPTFSVDTGAAVNIVFSCTLANTSDTATLEAYIVKVKYGA